ncbi:hypothetical protein Acsp06_51230 [Actinomycetospora sp. NBRC 106375]|uniref:STAS domain-containing protein n=1 Tax=Actinomycetospora sp. NBRC 106375 TaxID=3032207 RepID=UPI0024A43352|nr:STAS domain-containing protein [Actinomycetospora sp. NBRC 106375]GLZ48938.1 hypothetical protein Acsp06_51230 [Actinomycetospora sp. NBRC 106375]
MCPSPRLIVMWTIRHHAQVTVDGHADADAVERLDRALDLIMRAHGRHITVDLTRLEGRDADVLEVLAATWHRLSRAGGRLHVVGLRRRLITDPEVSAFPEVFGRPRFPARPHPA